MSEVKIVRLTSGEELIAKVTEGKETYTLNNPAILIPTGKDQLAFGQWLPYANIKDGIEIKSKYVVFVIDPMDEMETQYNEAFGPSSGLVVPNSGPVVSGAGLKLTQ